MWVLKLGEIKQLGTASLVSAVGEGLLTHHMASYRLTLTCRNIFFHLSLFAVKASWYVLALTSPQNTSAG